MTQHCFCFYFRKAEIKRSYFCSTQSSWEIISTKTGISKSWQKNKITKTSMSVDNSFNTFKHQTQYYCSGFKACKKIINCYIIYQNQLILFRSISLSTPSNLWNPKLFNGYNLFQKKLQELFLRFSFQAEIILRNTLMGVRHRKLPP